jgi:hypothetical protein
MRASSPTPGNWAAIAFVDGSAYFYIMARDIPPPDVPHEHPRGRDRVGASQDFLGWLSRIALTFVVGVNRINACVF